MSAEGNASGIAGVVANGLAGITEIVANGLSIWTLGPSILTPRTVTGTGAVIKTEGTADAGIYINSNGTIGWRSGNSASPVADVSEWLPGAVGADWQARCVQNSGDAFDYGTSLTSWWGLGSNRNWWFAYTGTAGSKTAVVTIEFRKVSATGTVYSFPNLTFVAAVS